MNSEIFKREVRTELTEHILPFWKRLRDTENGGFYGYMSYDLQTDKAAEKGCILNSRILYFFSECSIVLRDTECLKYAEHAYRFLTEHCVDVVRGGVYWSLCYDGSVKDSTKHTYNQAFAIYALSAYYRASGKEAALELAGWLYQCIETKMCGEGGYLEAFDENFAPVPNDKLSENGVIAERTMNTVLHVMEAYTYYARVSGKEEVRKRLAEILRMIRTKIYDPERKRLKVFMDSAYRSILDMHSYGHDIEAAWLIDRAAEEAGDDELKEGLRRLTAELERAVYQQGFDGSSIPAERERGVVKQDRVWWVQAEGINGYWNAYHKAPHKEEYLEAVFGLWDFTKKYVIDYRKGGEWFWYVDREGIPAREPIVEPWKCPYHNGRMCLNVIRE